MPYSELQDLPEAVRHVLPKHAQEIYKEAFNSTWDEYKDPARRHNEADREEVAHRVVWSAVKNTYSKGTDGN